MIKQERTEKIRRWEIRRQRINEINEAYIAAVRAKITAVEASERTQAMIDIVKGVYNPPHVIFGNNAMLEYNMLFVISRDTQGVDLQAVFEALPPEAQGHIRGLFGYRP